ncbi:MAG: hypothetical protein GTO14_21335 [Anaerolineales bacterium]|nr:hypothetical protein [Anaerolineales bacterium]
MKERLVKFLLLAIITTSCTSIDNHQKFDNTPSDIFEPDFSPTYVEPTRDIPTKVTSSPTSVPSSQVLTFTPEPTSTPLVSIPLEEDLYQLVNWNPELSNQLIADLNEYLETLSDKDRGRLDVGYYLSHKYVILAEEEAIYRFPDSEFSENWRWDLAFNYALVGSKSAGEIYSDLVSHDLNSGKVQLSDLVVWLQDKEPRLQFEFTSLPPVGEYQINGVLTIGNRPIYGTDPECGAYIWILKEKDRFIAYSLRSTWDFGFINRYGLHINFIDLLRDGNLVAITEHIRADTFYRPSNINIYDIGKVPPVMIEFDPPVSMVDHATWTLDNADPDQIIFSIYEPTNVISCAENIGTKWIYRFDGSKFKLYEIRTPPFSVLAEHPRCSDILIRYDLLWEIQSGNQYASAPVLELIINYPFSDKHPYSDQLYPPDERDSLRFRIGLYSALYQDYEVTLDLMESILENPASEESRWIIPASHFLTTFRRSFDLLDTCLSAEYCFSVFGIEDIVKVIPAEHIAKAPQLMQEMGVQLFDSGVIDFNLDGTLESWILFSSEPSFYTLWAVQNIDGSLRMIELGALKSDNPIMEIQISLLHEVESHLIYQIAGGEDKIEIIIWRDHPTGKIKSSYLDDYSTELMLKDIEADLFSGKDMQNILDRLLAIDSLPCWSPFASYCSAEARIAYLIGLFREMGGNSLQAKSIYYQIWQNYPYSPYSVMAKSKLAPLPRPCLDGLHHVCMDHTDQSVCAA